MTVVSTDLKVLMAKPELVDALVDMPAIAAERGYHVRDIHVDVVVLSCEPENMLVTQFEQQEGHVPIAEELHNVMVHGDTDLSLVAATQAIVAALPSGSYWYGTTNEGIMSPDLSATCAWSS